MPFALRSTLEIAAPVDSVWEVICDLDRYGEWNPFVVGACSSLVVGEPISMRVRLLPFLVQSQTETILTHVPLRSLCYGVTSAPLGSVRSRRCHELRALSQLRTAYRSEFELEGWLAPVVRGLLGRRMALGFEAATAALGRRSEQLYRDGRATAPSHSG
ncbi:MAG: SRPBCC domain-containing protein [Myxococcota bacterium]